MQYELFDQFLFRKVDKDTGDETYLWVVGFFQNGSEDITYFHTPFRSNSYTWPGTANQTVAMKEINKQGLMDVLLKGSFDSSDGTSQKVNGIRPVGKHLIRRAILTSEFVKTNDLQHIESKHAFLELESTKEILSQTKNRIDTAIDKLSQVEHSLYKE